MQLSIWWIMIRTTWFCKKIPTTWSSVGYHTCDSCLATPITATRYHSINVRSALCLQ
jgi:hypothetical protein